MAQLQCKYGLLETIPGDAQRSESLQLYGEWLERQVALFRRFILPGAVIADLGAAIGAHTLAFARATGNHGHVYALESRPGYAATLGTNIALNHLHGTVTVHQAAPLDPGCDRECAVSDGTAGALALVNQLDALDVPRLDFINLALDSTVRDIFREGVTVFARCRPVIALSAGVIDDADETLAVLASQGYIAFNHLDYVFNPENYRRRADNVFGDQQQRTLILMPTEKVSRFDMRDLWAVHGNEAAADHARRLGPGASAREQLAAPDLTQSLPAAAQRCVGEHLHIIVPFRKPLAPTVPIVAVLDSMIDELREIDAKIFFHVDDGERALLDAALAESEIAAASIRFDVLTHASHFGFVSRCNEAFKIANAARADVILLDPDTVLFPGALREIVQVVRLDPMIGFVSPRSNRDKIAALPHSLQERGGVPRNDHAAFLRCSSGLPHYSFAPVVPAFCLFIKWPIHSEFGGFDEVFAQAGTSAVPDLIVRANRCGYRAVLANRAFAWHQGLADPLPEDSSAAILRTRYPEYLPLVDAYLRSPEYRAETLIDYVDRKDDRLVFAFDFSGFGLLFNGAFESGVKLLDAAVRSWPEHCRIAVYMNAEAWQFHGLARFSTVKRLDITDSTSKVSAIVRVGQPYDIHAMSRIVNRAPVIGVFMLDTISYDCGYLSLTFDHRIWRFVFGYADVVFANSQFTLERIASRFKFGSNVLQRVSRHSLDVSEYTRPRKRSVGEVPHIFVIGNHFHHKVVRPTVDAIAAAFPDRKIIAVGYGDLPSPYRNVEVRHSGSMSNAVFEKFYSDADAVIFPSHYEGFGFPILHALGSERPIYVRDSALYRELASQIANANNIHYFCTTVELVEDLRANEVKWVAGDVPGEQGGWDRSAGEVFYALEQARRTVSYDALVARLDQIDQLYLAVTIAPTPAKRVAAKVEAVVERMLGAPGVTRFARRAWRVIQRMRARSNR